MVYIKLKNLINGKRYIGQSINIERRGNNHRHYSTKCSQYPLYQAFEKYGIENFSFSILEVCDNTELDDREIYGIAQYNTYHNGYNQTTGGESSSNNIIKLSYEDLMIIYDMLLNSTQTQREIARQFDISEHTLSEINCGKTRIQNNYVYPLRKNKDKYICKDCGKIITANAIRCTECNYKSSQTVKRPNREVLKQLIREQSFSSIGKQYSVSDNTIRKWCKSYNLPNSKREINNYSIEEWANI